MKVQKKYYLRTTSEHGLLKESRDGEAEVLGETTLGIGVNPYFSHFELEGIIAKSAKGRRKATTEEGHRLEFLLTDSETEWLHEVLTQYLKDRKRITKKARS